MIKKAIFLFTVLIAALTTSGCEDLWEMLTSELSLLYGRWDVSKVYVDDSEEYYENTKYTYIFEKDGDFKFINRMGQSTNNPVNDTIKGKFTYDKKNFTLHTEFLIPDKETNLPSSTIVLFQIKEITSKRLLLEVSEDKKDMFSIGTTWDMNRNNDD